MLAAMPALTAAHRKDEGPLAGPSKEPCAGTALPVAPTPTDPCLLETSCVVFANHGQGSR